MLVSCSPEFDPEIRDEGVERANSALAICQEHPPDAVANRSLLLATPTTAGDITREARAAERRTIAPWDSLPPGHVVAECSFGDDPDGETVSYYVDDAGRSSPIDPGAPPPL